MLEFNFSFSIKIMFAFWAFVIIGTLTHELGHFSVAKLLGYNPTIHYGSTEFNSDYAYKADEDFKKMLSIYEAYKYEIDNTHDFEKKSEYFELNKKIEKKYGSTTLISKDRFLVILGGPIQTLLTSFLGLFILYKRKSKSKLNFKFWDWIGVFLSLFVLREVYNTVYALTNTVFFGSSNFIGDEFRISRYLELNEWFIPIITAFLGLLIALFVIFKVIPKQYCFSFIVAGLTGGLSGFVLWFGFLGPIVLP